MGKPVARDSNENEPSSSQVRQPDVNPSSSDAKTTKIRWYKIVSPQYDNIPEQRRHPWESPLERTTKAWSSTKRRHAWDRRQHDDLVNVYVRDNEGRGTS